MWHAVYEKCVCVVAVVLSLKRDLLCSLKREVSEGVVTRVLCECF